jgi:hypothetical protein
MNLKKMTLLAIIGAGIGLIVNVYCVYSTFHYYLTSK